MHRYLSDKKLGSFHYMRCSSDNGWEAGVWCIVSYIHGSPKVAAVASCTLDGECALAIDRFDGGCAFALDRSFIGKLFLAAGQTRRISAIRISQAAEDETTPSLSAASIRLRGGAVRRADIEGDLLAAEAGEGE